MLVSCSQMQAIEEAAFRAGATPRELMELAGIGLARSVRSILCEQGHGILFCGKGHNAGDILVAAYHLVEAGWSFEIRLSAAEEELAPLTKEQLDRLRARLLKTSKASGKRYASRRTVLFDGLLGIGARGEPREKIAEGIREMNRLRFSQHSLIVAADLPSGLDGDTGKPAQDCVQADLTVTFGFAKKGLVADTATDFVGRIELILLPELKPNFASKDETGNLITGANLLPLFPPRRMDSHKGEYGRVSIYAGSRGLTGAARLCSAAAVLGGAGLVTLFAEDEVYQILAAACDPAVMVRPLEGDLFSMQAHPADAFAIGPGIGLMRGEKIISLYKNIEQPAVFDADALNLLSEFSALEKTAGPRLLTPHPGEMQRLFPNSDFGMTRLEWAQNFADRFPVTLLLKGARTLLCERGKAPHYNTTGNPGMSTGGMGDILTGLAAAFLAQGMNTLDAGSAAAWICGRAGDLALRDNDSPESLSPVGLLQKIPAVLRELRMVL